MVMCLNAIRKYSEPFWWNTWRPMGSFGLTPPLAPQKHLGTQRDLWDDRRSWNVKRRIEGEVVVKREGAPLRRLGGARRSEAASANLIWWECIHAEEQEIPAGRQHWSAQILCWRDREIGSGGWSMVCDLKVEKAITENLKVGMVRIVLH